MTTTPWTKVTVDGRSHGASPVYRIPLPAGVHRLLLENPQEGIRIQRQIRIHAGKPLKLKCTVAGGTLGGDCARSKDVW